MDKNTGKVGEFFHSGNVFIYFRSIELTTLLFALIN